MLALAAYPGSGTVKGFLARVLLGFAVPIGYCQKDDVVIIDWNN